MASLNKVILIGNATRDPETRYVGDGVPVCKLSIATNERYVDKAGAQQERAEFHNVVLWRRNAEIAQEYVTKGRQVYVEGKISTNTWTDQNNIKHYRTEIVADRILLLGSRKDFEPSSAPPANRQAQKASAPRDFDDDDDLGPPISDYDESIFNPQG